MITLHNGPVTLLNGCPRAYEGVKASAGAGGAGNGTIAYRVIGGHNVSSEPDSLKIKFDSLISHDITYVGIIQTARASGMTRFPVPYVLTNCHNSLCAVGGTINEDDHVFGLSAARKYGGVYVPANQAVIHQYAREALAESGGMVLGSDSHTRYGAIGTMGIGEGGPELVKQLLGNTYDINPPEVVLVWLENAPPHGVGPHDIAVALCGAVYGNGFVRNKILEFAGPGLAALPMDFRFGIDVMTTETACLSSIWRTDDETVAGYYERHGRKSAYKPLTPEEGAIYDAMIKIDLALAEPMIAMPFHPSAAYTINDMRADAADILRETEREIAGQFGGKLRFTLTDKIKDGRLMTDQGVIAGCAGGMYDNIREAAAILDGTSVGDGYFSLSVYPSSIPVNLQLIESGVQGALMRAGALFKPCFCGPCFGAGDVPANNGFSVRHTTRNFMNREGSKPGDGQLAAVALMDARSIAATARNGGLLTSASDVEYDAPGRGIKCISQPVFDAGIYEKRVYNGYGNPAPEEELVFGPNIADWPGIDALGDNLLLRLASVIHDPVTTTDELIPSGEASSYRSNPIKLAGFTLSRRDPQYVGRAKAARELEDARQSGGAPEVLLNVLAEINAYTGADYDLGSTQSATAIFAKRPGDGSAREQAASCQRVLGGAANICYGYATKRYRSNLINWGMLPFTTDENTGFTAAPGDWIFVPGVKARIGAYAAEQAGNARTATDGMDFNALLVGAEKTDPAPIKLHVDALTAEECEIILCGCLMNYYASKK